MLKLDTPILLPFFAVTKVELTFGATKGAVLTVAVLTEAEVQIDSHALAITNGASVGLRPSKQGVVEEFLIDLPTGYSDLLIALSDGKAVGLPEQAAEQWASDAGVLPPGSVV